MYQYEHAIRSSNSRSSSTPNIRSSPQPCPSLTSTTCPLPPPLPSLPPPSIHPSSSPLEFLTATHVNIGGNTHPGDSCSQPIVLVSSLWTSPYCHCRSVGLSTACLLVGWSSLTPCLSLQQRIIIKLIWKAHISIRVKCHK